MGTNNAQVAIEKDLMLITIGQWLASICNVNVIRSAKYVEQVYSHNSESSHWWQHTRFSDEIISDSRLRILV
jgi:hypothetical protein